MPLSNGGCSFIWGFWTHYFTSNQTGAFSRGEGYDVPCEHKCQNNLR